MQCADVCRCVRVFVFMYDLVGFVVKLLIHAGFVTFDFSDQDFGLFFIFLYLHSTFVPLCLQCSVCLCVWLCVCSQQH